MKIIYNILKIFIVLNLFESMYYISATILDISNLILSILFVLAIIFLDGAKEVKALIILYALSIFINPFLVYDYMGAIFISTVSVFVVTTAILYFLKKYLEEIS